MSELKSGPDEPKATFPVKSFALVGEVLSEAALSKPDLEALIYFDQLLTYRELDEKANQAARWLMAKGLQRGDRLAVLSRANIAFFAFFFAAARLGLCFISLNWRLSAGELKGQLDDATPKLILCDEASSLLLSGLPCQKIDGPEGAALQSELESFSAAPLNFEKKEQAPKSDDLVVMQYTSGTSGRAKGVALTHRAWLAAREADALLGSWHDFTEKERVLVPTPLFHIAGLGWAFMGLYQRASLILLPEFRPDQVIEAMEQHRATRVMLVPVMLALLIKEPRLKTADLSSLKLICYGASLISPALLQAGEQAFASADFYQLYGMTEVAGGATCLSPQDHKNPRYRASVGRAFGGRVKICDPDGQACPIGEVGEVWIKTKSLMQAYWGNEAATREAIIDGWYRSGDGGYLDGDGYLYLKDRIKDMIISGGENIYPSEVEERILALGLVQDGAAFGLSHPLWGEVLAFAYIAKNGVLLNLEDLRFGLKNQLAGYKMPRLIFECKLLPRGPSGKILRRVLRDIYEAALSAQ